MLEIDRLILRLPPDLAPRKKAIERALRAELATLETAGLSGREQLLLPPLAMRAGETSTALARRIGRAVGRSLSAAGSDAGRQVLRQQPTVRGAPQAPGGKR